MSGVGFLLEVEQQVAGIGRQSCPEGIILGDYLLIGDEVLKELIHVDVFINLVHRSCGEIEKNISGGTVSTGDWPVMSI
mgnify:CR=1 FL=1